MPKAVAKSWFKMKSENGVGKISILGDIGGFGVNFESFNRALSNLGPVNEIHLAINSDGGEVNDGFAIYNALAMHPATKTVTVMGLAASMASVVAMAGDKRVMPKNAVMMIHDPVGMIAGNAEEISSYGEFVGDMRDKIAQTYADASNGKTSKNKFLALMDKQSWLGATQCMALGLCTEVTEPQKMAAHFNVSPKAKESAMTKKTVTADDFEGNDAATVTATAVTEAKATAKAEILAQQKEVNALCRLAGKSELAAKFNEDGLTVVEAMAEIEKLPKKTGAHKPGATVRDGDIEISARSRVDVGDEGANADLDTSKIYANYNRKPGTARIQ